MYLEKENWEKLKEKIGKVEWEVSKKSKQEDKIKNV
jgi:hypothetical protein